MMKLHWVYVLYIKDENCNDIVYEWHYKLLHQYSKIFDSIHIIININEQLYFESDIVYRIKSKLIDILDNNNIELTVEFNNPNYREGEFYKKYVYEQLEKFKDTLIFFGHSKGVTNQSNYDYINNSKLWIYSLYYLNLNWIEEMKRKLVDEPNYIFYGGLYFKDYRHNNINNWFYSGSFHWVNPKRLLKYFKDNNVDPSQFFIDENEHIKRCAEIFVGIVPVECAAFHTDERFNKYYEPIKLNGNELSYMYVEDQVKLYLNIWEYDELKYSMNKLL